MIYKLLDYFYVTVVVVLFTAIAGPYCLLLKIWQEDKS